MPDIHTLITDRWSPFAFDDRPVLPEIITSLFEAAAHAPSSRNAQPWRFIYATKDMPEYNQLFSLLNERNQQWAGTAPLLVLGVSEQVSISTGRKNRFALYDTGMAVMSLIIQATHLDLYVHQMGGYHVERAIAELKIPPGFLPASMIAIGYKGSAERIPKEFAEREQRRSTRKPVKEYVFRGTWKGELEPGR